MNKPRGRKNRKKVRRILDEKSRSRALALLEEISDDQLVGHLFSHFYNGDELIKFRSVTAMGELVLRLAGNRMEKARIVLRRIMWNLNDESGGIGWGSPEAMGEILARCPELALDFKSILFSYLDDRGNFIEHEILQRGVLWGVGTFLKSSPDGLDSTTAGLIRSFLISPDPVKRAYAIRALIHGKSFDCGNVPENLLEDETEVDIYTGWNFIKTRISDMVLACTPRKAQTV
ncbi:DVU0298 family protein [Desulfospira joergensenii]|uniref:DVU0298 family protein n=1 Tax=Desulfospira joergensenii TaxID=53329 RepID=UPI0003B43650|nr:DVU0298 family protein [Desulfospira joergensenii]